MAYGAMGWSFCLLLAIGCCAFGVDRLPSESCLQRIETGLRQKGSISTFLVLFESLMGPLLNRTTQTAALGAYFGMKYAELMHSGCAETEYVEPFGPLRMEPTRLDAPPFAEPVAKAECDALADIYDSMNGPKWKNQTGWSDRQQLRSGCCNDSYGTYGVECSGHGRIARLTLSDNGLVGSVPESIGQLHSLTTLYDSVWASLDNVRGFCEKSWSALIFRCSVSWIPTASMHCLLPSEN